MTALCILATLAFGLDGEAGTGVRAWEDRILAERRTIKSGILHLKSEVTYIAQNNQQLSSRYVVKFDTGRLLLDKTAIADGHSERTVICRNGGEVSVYSSTALVDGKVQPYDYVRLIDDSKTIRPLSQIDKALKSGGRLQDPLAVGLVPIDFANTANFSRDAMFRRGDAVEATVADGRFERTGCKMLRATLKNDSIITVYFRADGPLVDVLCVEWAYGQKGINFVDRVVSQNKTFETPAGPVLYPERCLFTQTQNGHPLRTENLTIEVVSLNTHLEASSFTIASMNLPPGTQVAKDPKDGPAGQIWDGEKVIPMHRPSTPQSRSPFTPALLVGVVAPFLFLGAILYFRFRGSKRVIRGADQAESP